MSHTKEPLTYMELPTADGEFMVLGGDGDGDFGLVASCVKLEDARRIVACVNACEAIPTYQLTVEDGKAAGIGGTIDFLRKQRDELAEQVECATITRDNMEGRLNIMVVKLAATKAERDGLFQKHNDALGELIAMEAQRDELLALLEDAVDQIRALSGNDNSCDPDVDVSEYEAAITSVKDGA